MNDTSVREDFRLIRQSPKDVFVKVELLNKQFKILESLHTHLISDHLNIDNESKQRRTYTCDLHVTDSSFTSRKMQEKGAFLVGDDKKIWIDKYIRIYYGIQSVRTGEITWWLLGTFTYIDMNYTYHSTDNTLSLSCGDLMSEYDGTKNGVIGGPTLLIPAGQDIRESVIALIKHAGITKYNIEDIGKEIPYDLEFSESATYCEVWTTICELYDSWEFFFSPDGTFIWREIPTGYTEPCMMDDTILQDLLVNESLNTSFSGIYNVTEVWGKVLEMSNNDRYADTSTWTDGIYHVELEGITTLDYLNHLDQISINICEENSAEAKVSINGLEAIPIVNDDGSAIDAGRMKADTVYTFSYRRNLGETIKNCLYLLGQYQAQAVYEEANPECPFSTTRLGYQIKRRETYDQLYSDELCYNQAEYLTYQTTAMMDAVTLELLIIPWLDVNQKISYTPKSTGITSQYMIKNLSWSTLSGTMTLTLYRFLESFSYVKNKISARDRRIS